MNDRSTSLGNFIGSARPGTVAPWLIVGLAAIASATILWLPTRSPVLVAGFAAAAVVAGAIAVLMRGNARPAPARAEQGTDWSLVRAIADGDAQGLAVTDRTGRLVCANDHYCDWFGGAVTPPSLPVDARTNALLAEAGRTAWRDGEAAVADFTSNGRTMSGIVQRIGHAEDHLLWRWQMHAPADPLGDALTHLVGPLGRTLGEAGVMVAVVTPAGTIRMANSAFRLRAAGLLEASVEGQDFAALLRVDRAGQFRIARERDSALPLRLVEVPLSGEGDAPLLILMLDEDRLPADPGLAPDLIDRLVQALPSGIAMVDRDGRFLSINPAFARAVGCAPDALPTYPGDLLVAEDKGAIGDAIRRHASGRGTTGEISVRLRGVPDAPVSIGLVGLRGLGQASVLLTLSEPGTAASVPHERLEQASKMQAIGQLAGGIAHDFNNILTAILGACDLMLLRHQPGDSDYDDIQQVRSNSNRAANLTRQLLAFSRQQTLRPQILNLSDIVADVSHLLERLIGETVKLSVTHGRGLGAVRADPVQLEQVIVNLAVNARDAMPRGGTLTIATTAVGPKRLPKLQGDVMPPGDYSLLTVTDSGTGISPDVLPKIFDPFFTTKEVGKGTGLGLATVYGIVKQSEGYIFAESQAGEGTRFSIYFPVYKGAEPVEPQRPAPGAGARSLHWGSGTILLVEDEDMVRAVAERALLRAGYTVVTAGHGEEGLERFGELAEVDLIVSDVMMPQMDGPAMVAAIRARRDDVPVLFMSGYAEEQLRQTIALPNVAFLAKPFSVAQLVDAVAAIRDASK